MMSRHFAESLHEAALLFLEFDFDKAVGVFGVVFNHGNAFDVLWIDIRDSFVVNLAVYHISRLA